ncbi:MAG: GrpB family protein [Saccharospirillaceae bacterium]|nr:GrpB family protein [Colwellia sp.]NRB77218.1 GrpB family protein [Saccharospirillaceae bacterium]
MNQRIIAVVDYDPSWVTEFENEKKLLAKAIGKNAVMIEHIGSTAVKGLPSKPVIDILVEVTSIFDLDISSNKIQALGYIVKGENGIAGRRYFQKGGNQRSHHIHAFTTGDLNLIRHRAFKEYLIAHPMIATEYGEIKKSSVLICENNINTYMELKNKFIQKYEKLAVAWFNS